MNIRSVSALVCAGLAASPALAAFITDSAGGRMFRAEIDVRLEQNSETFGDIAALNDFIGTSDVDVTGRIDYGNSGSIGGFSNVSGGLHQTPNAFTPVTVPTFGAANANDQHVADWSNASLSPGTYGALTGGNFSEWSLTSGEYIFSSVSLSGDADISVDTSGGDTFLYVHGNFDLGSWGRIEVSGSGELFVVSLGAITLGDTSTAYGNYYAFGGDFRIRDSADFFGTGYSAQSIIAEGWTDNHYNAINSANPIPGAGAAGLAMVWAGFASRRRRPSTMSA